MKKVLLVAVVLTIFIFNNSFANEITFLDIENHWAKNDIEKILKDNAISGYEDGTFKPDKEVTIAEFLKILLDENNIELVKEGKRWPDWYINTAKKKGYISDNVLLDINEKLSRGEACKILANYININDLKPRKIAFTDVSKENKNIISKLVELNVINGYKDSTFRENEFVTRAQACKLILSAYNAKVDLLKERKVAPSANNTNIGIPFSGDVVTKTRYEMKNNRIYVLDNSRINNKITLNQEYVDDTKVIKLINSLVDDDSYTEIFYVTDDYLGNTFHVSYGARQSYVNNGNYNINVAFYENSKYDVAKATDTLTFSDHAYARITLRQLFDRVHEVDDDFIISDKYLFKLEETLGCLTESKYKKEMTNYIVNKLKLAKSLPENEFYGKVIESKKFGKYTLDLLCMRGTWFEIYVSYN